MASDGARQTALNIRARRRYRYDSAPDGDSALRFAHDLLRAALAREQDPQRRDDLARRAAAGLVAVAEEIED